MDIVGFHIKNKTIANSEGEIIQTPPYLKWLLQHKNETIQVFYDLQSCIEPLLEVVGISGKNKDE